MLPYYGERIYSATGQDSSSNYKEQRLTEIVS